LRAIDKERVNPECVSPTPQSLRQQPDRVEVTYFDRRDDDAIDACTMDRGDNRVPIRIKFGSIQVAVRIDQHTGHCDCA
jgi:hypothetical protein